MFFSLMASQVTSHKVHGSQIGINYIGHEQGELHGCINDVHNIREFVMGKWKMMVKALLTCSLESFGYEVKNIVTLTDDEEDPVHRPTRDNIVCFSHWTPFFSDYFRDPSYALARERCSTKRLTFSTL